jgi:phosphoglycerate-specific signal transduction histidine kinase
LLWRKTADNLTQGADIAEAGVTMVYGLALEVDSVTGSMTGKVISAGVSEQNKALSEGFISAIGLLTHGADNVIEKGIGEAVKSARSMARAGAPADSGLAAFGGISGGSAPRLKKNKG